LLLLLLDACIVAGMQCCNFTQTLSQKHTHTLTKAQQAVSHMFLTWTVCIPL